MTTLTSMAPRTHGDHPGRDGRARAYDALSIVVIGAAFAITAAVYARLPARMPIHFDVHGVADGFASRSIGAFLTPAIALAVLLFVRGGARLLPASWRARTATSAAALLMLIVTIGLVAMHFVTLHVALSGAGTIGVSLGVVIGALWLALGLVMPRLQRNPWMGFRTPWTITSDENWARTHRVAGICMTIGGIVSIAAGLAGSLAIGVVAVLVTAAIPLVYSFLLARELEGR